MEEGYPEEVVVVAWLSAFIDSDKGTTVSRHLRRLIHKAEKRLGVGEYLKDRIEALIEATAQPTDGRDEAIYPGKESRDVLIFDSDMIHVHEMERINLWDS